VDFTEIRPNCTEITLAVHYEIKNKLFVWLDRRLHFVDTFVTAELRSIRAHFEGIARRGANGAKESGPYKTQAEAIQAVRRAGHHPWSLASVLLTKGTRTTGAPRLDAGRPSCASRNGLSPGC
jgi:hypothetical protein